jgi:hypothetical protein
MGGGGGGLAAQLPLPAGIGTPTGGKSELIYKCPKIFYFPEKIRILNIRDFSQFLFSPKN